MAGKAKGITAQRLHPMNDSPLDPDVVRRRTLDALDVLPVDARLDALVAVERGDLEIELCSFTGELTIRIGTLRVILDRASCSVDDGVLD